MNNINLGTSSILTIISMIEFVLWSMGKVPYGFLCWLIPLVLTIALNALKYFQENA